LCFTYYTTEIVLNHLNYFKQKAFGKFSNNTEFLKILYPYNLLYLAWKLHDSYNSSDKDKLLNINANIICNLYDSLFEFYYN
jgi:hypothetical protein